MTDLIVIQTTAGSAEEAQRISHSLLEQNLAACVQVTGPVESRYWWDGTIETATEWICAAKTHNSRYAEAEAAIRAAHSYDEPEIIATPICRVSDSYGKWVMRNSTEERGSDGSNT